MSPEPGPTDYLNRKDLSRQLADKLGRDDEEVDEIVVGVLEAIVDELAHGRKVSFRGFGTFEPRQMRAVTRRKPDTGEPIEVPPSVRVIFRPSQPMKDRVATGPTNGTTT